MSAKIQSRWLERGNEKEDLSMPEEPRGERGRFYWNPETKKMQRGRYVSPSERVHILTDEIPPTESMADGTRKIFTSRAKLEAYDRARGYVHTGGDHIRKRPAGMCDAEWQVERSKDFRKSKLEVEREREDIHNDAERAYYDIKYDRVPFTEKEKELCRQEENAFNQYKKRQ